QVDHLLAPPDEVSCGELPAPQHGVEATPLRPAHDGFDDPGIDRASALEAVLRLEVLELGPHAYGLVDRAAERPARPAGHVPGRVALAARLVHDRRDDP